MLASVPVAVVVPAFNEAAWIGETVARMPAFVDRVVVVDDASHDATVALAEEAGRRRTGSVEVVRHRENRGVGAAIVTGYRRARARGAGVVAVMAGDGQMHPDDLEGLLGPILRGESDYVKGNRLRYPGAWRVMPPARLAGTAVLAWATRHAAGLGPMGDSQCGYTAISGEAIDGLDLEALWPRYGYPNDLLGALARGGFRVSEHTVRPVYRGEASGAAGAAPPDHRLPDRAGGDAAHAGVGLRLSFFLLRWREVRPRSCKEDRA